MASLPLVSKDSFLISQGNFDICLHRPRIVLGNGGLSFIGSASYPVSWRQAGQRTYCRFRCCGKLSNAEQRFLKGENNGPRKDFGFRLQSETKLLLRRLKHTSIKSVLDGLGTFLRKNVKQLALTACVSVVLGFCFIFLKVTAVQAPRVVPYSDMILSLQNGNIAKVLFEEGSRRIYYNTKSFSEKGSHGATDEHQTLDSHVLDDVAVQENAQKFVSGKDMAWKVRKPQSSVSSWEFSTRKIDHDEGYVLSLMRDKGISYSSAPPSIVMSMRNTLITVLTLWIPLTPLMWLLYRQLSAASSPARRRKPTNQLVTFEDVEGVDTAKMELMEIVCCLQGSINYSKLGAKLPRGVLLVGPPGTGKTLLARAVAGEAGVPFFSVSASEFVELFVGRGAARIRDLFSVARKNAPSIIFIDELDAVGGKRGRSFNDERDQTLNQLLTEMDGFESGMNIIVIAATNRPEALDPALCRPGRFSRKVYVGEPDLEGRRKILAIHLRDIPLEEEESLMCSLIGSLTQGLVGADLANIVNEAALLAARRGAEKVSREDIMEAIERARFGIKEKQTGLSTISKEVGKWFPWMPPLLSGNDNGKDGIQGPLGYQTLS